MGNGGSGESVAKTAGEVYNEAWDKCAAKHNWTPVPVDRPVWAKECDEAASRAVIAWYEAQQWRPMADAPRDGEFILVQYKAGHYSVLHWDDGCWWTKGRDRYADDSQCLRWRYPEAR